MLEVTRFISKVEDPMCDVYDIKNSICRTRRGQKKDIGHQTRYASKKT